MKEKLKVSMEGIAPYKDSGIKRGPLRLPEGLEVDGELIAFGEDECYLHCVVSLSGDYIGLLKSSDKDCFYQHVRRLNVLPG